MEALIADLSKMQISQFFERNAPTTQQQCDKEAARISSGSVHPATVQGGTSYTAVASTNNGTLIVQFRNANSALALDILDSVKKAYGDFVPNHENAGGFRNLLVYTMNDVGGIAMYLARDQLHNGNYSLLRTTLQDYARFVDAIVPYNHSLPPLQLPIKKEEKKS